jgi:nicotinate-nucleotide pyrophosphorylase (carboxylating)
MAFSVAESDACQRLIDLALAEDLDLAGDVTSQAVIPETTLGRAVFVARNAGILAGLPAAVLTAKAVDPSLTWEAFTQDGAQVVAETELAELRGSMRSILAVERTALNFLQHLSGIATTTRCFVDAIAGFDCQILDTRKTLPGWRLLAKYAVRCGGGHNHRLGLHDGILIKDNHLAALAGQSLTATLAQAQQFDEGRFSVEVEVANLDQFDQALAGGAEIILLDNMSLADMAEAVARRNQACTPENYVLLEASGGIRLDNVRAVAQTGVDRISVGALTHSAPALDIALDYQPIATAPT